MFSAVTTYGVRGSRADDRRALRHRRRSAARRRRTANTPGAAGVVAWTAVGVFFQGVYLLTSIGLNITTQHAVLSGHRPSAAAAATSA